MIREQGKCAKSHVVVVLSYFGREDTIACVESIRAGGEDVQPLVVDNGSRDGVIEEVISLWGDEVSTLQLESNLGFTGGMNAGLRWALARGAATITVLNNDTVCRPGSLSRLEHSASRGAAVAPEIRYLTEPHRIWFAGGAVDERTGLAHHVPATDLPAPSADGVRPTEVVTGCCVTARASVWESVGLFDERFFLNFEDSEWSLRARAAGVPLIVDTRAVIEHRVSASFAGAFSYLGLYFYARNGIVFIRENGAAGRLTTPRFIRKQLLPALRPRPESGGARRAGRRAIVLAYAARDVTFRRYGTAPQRLHRRAARWAAADIVESRRTVARAR